MCQRCERLRGSDLSNFATDYFREIKTIFKLNLNLNLKFNLNLNLKFNSNILNLNLQLREPGCLLAKNIPGSINSRNRPFNNKLYLSQ